MEGTRVCALSGGVVRLQTGMLFKRMYQILLQFLPYVSKKEPCQTNVQNASYGHGPSSYLGTSGYTWCRSKAAVRNACDASAEVVASM